MKPMQNGTRRSAPWKKNEPFFACLISIVFNEMNAWLRDRVDLHNRVKNAHEGSSIPVGRHSHHCAARPVAPTASNGLKPLS
jgi:hypothetical protein